MKNEPAEQQLKNQRKRTAGRPSEGSLVGQEKITNAVIEMLRQRQPQELKLTAVAAHAGVDPALVRYYFGNMKTLLQATAKKLVDDIQERSGSALLAQGSLKERIRTRLQLLIDVLQDNPRFLQLVLNEIYQSGEQASDTQAIEIVANRGLELTQVLLNAPDSPVATRQVDSRYLHVAILGMCTFFHDAQPLLAILFKGEKGSQAILDGYVDFATELLTRGLESKPETDCH